MTDLVEKLRLDTMERKKFADSSCDHTKFVTWLAADEIERLQRDVKLEHDVGIKIGKRLVIEDMRKFCKDNAASNKWGALWNYEDLLNAYAKDRGIE